MSCQLCAPAMQALALTLMGNDTSLLGGLVVSQYKCMFVMFQMLQDVH